MLTFACPSQPLHGFLGGPQPSHEASLAGLRTAHPDARLVPASRTPARRNPKPAPLAQSSIEPSHAGILWRLVSCASFVLSFHALVRCA